MESRYIRLLKTLALVIVAVALGFLGRTALDWLISFAPGRPREIEYFGQWVIGIVIVVCVVIPMIKVHNGFKKKD